MARAATASPINLEDLPEDIILYILNRLDGPSLVSIGCSSSHLHRLSSLPSLWLNLCRSMCPSLLLLLLPSLPSSPRSFFSLIFRFPFPSSSLTLHPSPDSLISLVYLRYRGAPIFSTIILIDTGSSSFLSSPFRLEAMDNHLQSELEFLPRYLEPSWVMVDRIGRAVDLSSWMPVSVETNWFNGRSRVRFAMVVGKGRATAIVTVKCNVDGGRKVGLMVEDGDGVPMKGMDSMVIIRELMEGERG